MTKIRVLVWKKGTNWTMSQPDYTIEIEAGLLISLVGAIERIAAALEEKE